MSRKHTKQQRREIAEYSGKHGCAAALERYDVGRTSVIRYRAEFSVSGPTCSRSPRGYVSLRPDTLATLRQYATERGLPLSQVLEEIATAALDAAGAPTPTVADVEPRPRRVPSWRKYFTF